MKAKDIEVELTVDADETLRAISKVHEHLSLAAQQLQAAVDLSLHIPPMGVDIKAKDPQ